MRRGLRQRLFRRRNSTPALPPLVPLCWYEQRTHELIDEDLVKYPEMCKPDIKPKYTARITRIIQAETIPDRRWWLYEDETERVPTRGVDVHATQPMRL